jgi:hypothetical protein
MPKKKNNKRRNSTLFQWRKKNKLLPSYHLSKRELADYKRSMQSVVDYANTRIDQALENHEGSLELHRFLGDDESKRFSISQLTDPADIRVAMTELRTVLSTIDEGSMKGKVDNAIIEAEVYRTQFGNQHRGGFTDDEGNFRIRHYNTNDVFDEQGNLIRRAIDPSKASKAFAAYRRLEEEFAGYIGRQGQEMMFGSENLIILLYDFYDKNPGADYNYDRDHATGDAYDYAKPLLDEWILEQLKSMEGINYSFTEADNIVANWEEFIEGRYF